MTTKLETILRRSAGRDARADAAAAAEATALRAAAEGVADLVYATIDSPLGPLFIASSARGLIRVAYPGDRDPVEELAARVSPRIVEAPEFLDSIRRELDEYFAGKRVHFDAPLDWALIGGFNRRVLRATAAVPYGSTASYREVATAAGSPRAVRAAGNALGRNPIPIVIPCHRILRTGGALGGYGGGLERKQQLLELEGARG
jgi:methylated-DNA-[protein]-cysteine S-methyltransferase